MPEVELRIPHDELEVVVDVLYAEAYRRRRQGEPVPPAMLASMRRLNAASEGVDQGSRWSRWLTLGLKA